MQLVNVALGGDLLSHIPDHFGDKVRHRHPELRPVEHLVNIEPASRLARILGATELTVHSVHHQAVGRLGLGLRAVAWSPDGVIEAVESTRLTPSPPRPPRRPPPQSTGESSPPWRWPRWASFTATSAPRHSTQSRSASSPTAGCRRRPRTCWASCRWCCGHSSW